MNPNNNRSMLYGVVGGYLLYLAYELVKNLIDDVSTTMPQWLQILAAVFFAAMGVLLLVFAVKIWKKGRQEPEEGRVEIGDEDVPDSGEKLPESGDGPAEKETADGRAAEGKNGPEN